MTALATQAWVAGPRAITPPAPERCRPVRNATTWVARSEPPRPTGGFWTSTYDERYGSAWVQWYYLGFHESPPDETFPIWTLEPDPRARIYTIDSYADLARLCRNYPCVYRASWLPIGPINKIFPDWERVAEDFDGVHLTDDGERATVRTAGRAFNLRGWGCERTFWLRWSFVGTPRDLGRVRCDCAYWSVDPVLVGE